MLKAFITDVDGTLTDNRRRLSTSAVEEMRRLIDADIPIILSSGNTICFLDTLSHMIGTDGNVIGENGGAYRAGYLGQLQIVGNRENCLAAYQKICDELQPKGDELRPFSQNLRYSDFAFSRDTTIETVRDIIKGMDLEAVDTGFAIHLHAPGITKGRAFEKMAEMLNLSTRDFLVAGDSINDVSMLELGGEAVVPANGSDEAKRAATVILEKPYGDGLAEALKNYF